jgi:uncharacterized Rmd1/YagE family protein
MKRKYTIVRYRVYNKDYKKVRECRSIVESENVNKFLEFVSGGNRIVVFDEFKEIDEDNLINKILFKIKDELQEEFF